MSRHATTSPLVALIAATVSSLVASAALAGGSPCPCATDFDYDGQTAASDLAIMLGAWGDTGFSDLDANGITDASDLAILLGAWGPCEGVENDECVNAIVIDGESVVVPFCTASATDSAQSFPLFCGSDGDAAFIGKDMWFRYIMPYDGKLIVHTYDSSFDTVLGVYGNIINSACGCPGFSPNAVLIACDDDIGSSVQSFVDFTALEGDCYNIRVGGYKGTTTTAAGPGQLTLRPIKRGDRCDISNFVPPGTFIEIDGTNSGDTWIEADQSSCASNDTRDEWYRFVMPCDGEVTISTCHPNTNFDTTLAVFDECGGTEIACNDDFSDPACALGGPNRKSRVSLIGSSGEIFFVRVAGFNGSSGDFRLVFDVDCVN